MLNDSFFNPFLFGSYYDDDRNLMIYQRHLQAEEERQRRLALQRQQEQRRIMLEQERRRKQQQLRNEVREEYLRQLQYEQYVKDLERKKKLRQQQQQQQELLQQQRQEQQRLMRSIYNDSQYGQDDYYDMKPGMVFQGPDGRFYRVVNNPNNDVNYKRTTNGWNDEVMKDTVLTKTAEKPTKTTTTKSTTTTVTKEQVDNDYEDPHPLNQPSPPSIHNVTYNNCFNRVLEETHHHHGELDGDMDGMKLMKTKTNKKKNKSTSMDNFRNKRGTLIGGVEDASDDESDDNLSNSVWVNRRPSDGQWMEPVDGYKDTIII